MRSRGSVAPVTDSLSHDALPAFAGRWAVRRKVIDRLTGAVQRFEGTALVEADRFTEEGEVVAGSSTFVARRSYLLFRQGWRLSLRFSNGADFIVLGLCARQTVSHRCGSDSYHGSFFFKDACRWVEFWRVVGPRKNYSSLARFDRMQG
ncbi:DUF6314 family protein [Aquamicrobium soli]|uniref:DUF6314 family protein n=1 Tax=Aquamicrobium soli TaxID=1811518 RepID=A0ABV7KEH8_9HYPH